jgi:hypothetical protein
MEAIHFSETSVELYLINTALQLTIPISFSSTASDPIKLEFSYAANSSVRFREFNFRFYLLHEIRTQYSELLLIMFGRRSVWVLVYCPEWNFLWFSSAPTCKWRDSTSIRLWQFPCKSLEIHSPATLTSSATDSEHLLSRWQYFALPLFDNTWFSDMKYSTLLRLFITSSVLCVGYECKRLL